MLLVFGIYYDLRLAKNAELVVVRGGEPGGVGTWPADWLKTRCTSSFSRSQRSEWYFSGSQLIRR